MNIAFIGLGHMGNPMASHLIKAGLQVKVYDVMTQAVTALVDKGAIKSDTVADAVGGSDFIITMLQTGEQVSSVCLDKNGIFANAKKDAIFIDSSSIDITVTRTLHESAKHLNIAMLDAPVSGGVQGAMSAALTIMVGGEEIDFLRAKPILEKMGKKIIYAGIAGLGQAAKICNNLILGISMIAVSEGFSLAGKLGLDLKKFFEISSNASGQCWSMTSYCPVPGILDHAPASHAYQAGFMAKMMLKDLHLGIHAGEVVDAWLPLGSKATELYERFVNEGHGELDFSAIITEIAKEKM